MTRKLSVLGKICLIFVLALSLQVTVPLLATSYAEDVSSKEYALVEAPDQFAVSGTTPTSISLSWQAIADLSETAISYLVTMVDVLETSGDEQVVHFDTAGLTQYSVEGLTTDHSYTFTVQAVKASGPVSNPSGPIVARTLPLEEPFPETDMEVTPQPDMEPPTAPELSLAGRGPDSIDLEWTPSVDNVAVTAYVINMNGSRVTEVTYGTTAFTIQGLDAGHYYTFTVQAQDAAGNVSPNSNELEFSTQTELKTSSMMSMGSGHAFHTLAVQPDGTVWGWGNNKKGQLGDNSAIYQKKPVQITGLPAISAVSVGQDHSLALAQDGSVWAWGDNAAGQLGIGTSDNKNVPTLVLGLSHAVAVQAGEQHSLVLLADGTVWAWGHNVYGQLGDGSTENRDLPVQVAGLDSIAAISAGAFHNLAVSRDGQVFSWGFNAYGQLGDNTTMDSKSPAQVAELGDVISVSAGFYHSMALKSDGTVWSWGTIVEADGTSVNLFMPVQVEHLQSIVSVSAGALHSMALKDDGTVWTWGVNNEDQLGAESEAGNSFPSELALNGRIAFISAGFMSSSAVSENGDFFTWGYNGLGQLGDGTQTNAKQPFIVQLVEESN